MALEYLNAGAVSFAAANWSAATGFVDNATLVAKLTGQTISADLDWSGLTTGINRFLLPVGSNGSVGTSAQGSLIVDIDDSTGDWSSANATRSRLEVFANSGQFYINAGGASGVISNSFIDTGGTFYFTGGTFTLAKVTRGTFNVNESTTLGTLWVWGPASGTIAPKTSGLTTLHVLGGVGGVGGTVVCQRAGTTINLYGGTLRYTALSGTTTTVNIYGGTFIHEAGAITTVNGYGGAYVARLERAATIGTFNRELPLSFTGDDPLLTITTSVALNPKIDL